MSLPDIIHFFCLTRKLCLGVGRIIPTWKRPTLFETTEGNRLYAARRNSDHINQFDVLRSPVLLSLSRKVEQECTPPPAVNKNGEKS